MRRLLDLASAWTTRHKHLVHLIDGVVVGPFVFLSFAVSLVMHKWPFVFVWGLQTWWFWKRRERKQKALPDQDEDLLTQVEDEIGARDLQ